MEDFVHQSIRLVRTGSLASELTGGGRSSDSVEHQAESHRIESKPMEWTDEKHSLYLKSMEASFVDQLYSSSDLHNWHSQKDGSAGSLSSRKMPANSYIPSGQFKVLQDGCWSKINFKRDESRMTKAGRSHALPSNPWIRHFKTGSRQQRAARPALQGKNTPALQQFLVSDDCLSRQDSTGSNTEVSDQNFPDEDVAREKTSRISSTKRMRTSVVASSSNDQVVPLGIFSMKEDVSENYASP